MSGRAFFTSRPVRGVLLIVSVSALAIVSVKRVQTVPNRSLSASPPTISLQSRHAFVLLQPPGAEARGAKALESSYSDEENSHANAWLSVSPVRRAALMSPEAMAPYETILAALKLPPENLRRLKEQIVERAESASDAEDLGMEDQLAAEQTSAVRNETEASFDQKIEDAVGISNFQVVRKMLQLTPQLQDIVHSAGRELSLNGVPLTADQILKLAHIYKDTYVGAAASPPVDRSAGFDPQTGLGEADRQTLAKASAVLNAAQVDLLRINLKKSNGSTYASQAVPPTGND